MNIEEARELLNKAEVFFDIDEEDNEGNSFKQILNMNDVWAWACADGEVVKDEELPELGRLFRSYGWCGVLYWVSEKRGGETSEFLDNNRMIEFVRHEEELIKKIPDTDDRAYEKYSYTLGEL